MSEPITVSLEIAKNLKEAGWSQGESYFVWRTYKMNGGSGRNVRVVQRPDHRKVSHMDYIYFAAPTSEEILRKLGCGKLYFSGKGQWTVILEGQDSRDCPMEDSAADACAACWISLPAYMRHSSSLSEV